MNAQLLGLTEQGDRALFVLVVIAIILVPALLGVSNVKQAREHAGPLLRLISKLFRPPADRSFLRAQGWEYAPRADLQWQGRFALPPLAMPTAMTVTDLAWADVEGLRCVAFTTWSGHAMVSIEMVELPVVLPPLAIYSPWLDDEEERRSPFPGQPFSSESGDFNARWTVRGGDPRYLSAVLSPRVMDRLLQDDLTDMIITVDGAAIVNWCLGPVAAETVLPHMTILRDLVRRIPQHVLDDFGAPRPDANGGPWGGARGSTAGQRSGRGFSVKWRRGGLL